MMIREFRQRDLGHIKRIIKGLYPQWFDKNALKNIPIDARLQKCLVAEDKNKIVGFISFHSKDGKAEIGWLGVAHNLRNIGIGKQLLKTAEKSLKAIAVNTLWIQTIGETAPE